MLYNAQSSKGMQVSYDTAPFGSFINSFFTAFRDEFPKLPSLSIPLLSQFTPISGRIDVDDVRCFLSNKVSIDIYKRIDTWNQDGNQRCTLSAKLERSIHHECAASGSLYLAGWSLVEQVDL